MTKTEKAIALIKKDPFQSAQEIAKNAGLSSTSSLSTILNQQGVSLGAMRKEAVKQLKDAVQSVYADDSFVHSSSVDHNRVFEYSWDEIESTKKESP